MKYVFNNEIIKLEKLPTGVAVSRCYIEMKSKKKVIVEDSFGENEFVLSIQNSLTEETNQLVFFSGDCEGEECYITMFGDVIVFNNDKGMFFVNRHTNQIISYMIDAKLLIGMWFTEKKELLIFSELGIDIFDKTGSLRKSIGITGIPEHYSFDGSMLMIDTDYKHYDIKMNEI